MMRILVPWDGSILSSIVFAKARRLFESAEVTVLGVGMDRSSIEAMEYELQSRGIRARGRIRQGDPAREILAEASFGDYDWIAMATHGASARDPMIFGSVTLRVIRSSPLPMFLYRPHADRETPTEFRRILVPLDGSPSAERILPTAETLARHFGSILFYLSVPRDPHRILQYLRDQVRRSQLAGLRAALETRTGDAAPAILKAARSLRVDAIALTTHGHSDDSLVVFGEVASEVLHDSDVPLVVVNSRTCRAGLETAARGEGGWQ